jgi:hypothetical protein
MGEGEGFDFSGGSQEEKKASAASAPESGNSGPSVLGKIWGGISSAGSAVVQDVKRVGGATVGAVTGENPSASTEASGPAHSSKLNPRVVDAINNKLSPADAQKLIDMTEGYVDGSAQLGRKARETITGIGNRELQKATKGIPVVGEVFRSAGNNTGASSAREAQIAQMIVNANKAANKADEFDKAGNDRAESAQVRTMSSQVDAATRAYTNVFGANSLEQKHIHNAEQGAIYNETTRVLNKVQPGGLPGFLDKVFK